MKRAPREEKEEGRQNDGKKTPSIRFDSRRGVVFGVGSWWR
jgi:hypothetical protein